MKRIAALILTALLASPAAAAPPASPEAQLKQHFTAAQSKRIKAYKPRFQAIKTEQDFAAIYREASALSDALAPALEKLYAHYQATGQLQDAEGAFSDKAFQWLNAYLPGLEVFVVAEGTVAVLFPVYAPFAQQARKTKGSADDRFVALLTEAYGDSENVMFPAWFYPTWDYGGCSLLGKGRHLKVLQMVQQNLKQSQLFQSETAAIKAQVLEDILNHRHYCQSQAEILAELDQILGSGTLTPPERQLLAARRKQFQQPPKELELGCNQGKDCQYG